MSVPVETEQKDTKKIVRKRLGFRGLGLCNTVVMVGIGR